MYVEQWNGTVSSVCCLRFCYCEHGHADVHPQHGPCTASLACCKAWLGSTSALKRARAAPAPAYVDVPGLSERPCGVAVLALAEGAATATVTLRNEATGEYVFWTLSIAAGAAPARCAAW